MACDRAEGLRLRPWIAIGWDGSCGAKCRKALELPILEKRQNNKMEWDVIHFVSWTARADEENKKIYHMFLKGYTLSYLFITCLYYAVFGEVK